MNVDHLERWILAHSDHLRNDPAPRNRADVIFEGKGYPPRNPSNIFEPMREEVK